MMTDSAYVHIDTTSNAVLMGGLTATDFANSIVHFPQNSFLLNPSASAGEYKSHTGLKVVRGIENIQCFSSSSRNGRGLDKLRRTGFIDLTILKELAPLEISGLSYFGHMRAHLHSSFFYKLQNNLVYFDPNDQLSRVYYRYLDEFYRIFASKLNSTLSDKIDIKKSFFRKETPVEKISVELLKEVCNLIQEGIIFSLDQVGLIDGRYHIPIYVIEDYIWKLRDTRYREEEIIATLIYPITDRHWQLAEDADLSYLPLK